MQDDRLQILLDYAVNQSPINMIKKGLKGVLALAGSAGIAISGMTAIKTGLSQAMDLEGYRLTLETVVKDTQKAKDLMNWGSEFANKTPFENDAIVEGIVKLQSYGMEAKKVLPSIGDMASVMGKSLDQGVEAIADAQSGELERLTFGLAA